MPHTPPWLAEAPIQRLLAATHDAGGEARVVGGAVRDFLMGVEGWDVDIASSLTPEQTMEIAKAEGWKAIPTGIAHGTVTLVLPTRIVEVTTLRRDVTTDGRRATVAYTDSFEEDAARRDFTINALSIDEAGTLHDYFGGKEHLAAHAVCFIGDAAMRIAEDGLRILRYFRFLATHGKPPANAEALAAIKEKKAMIAQLSGERIAAEMKKLLAAENPAYVLRLMEETGVAPLVFGRSITPAAMIRLHMFEHQAEYQCSVWARMVALLPNAAAADAEWLASRWKLSRHESQTLAQLAALPAFDASAPRHAHTRLLRLHGAPAYLDWLLTQAARTPGIAVAPFVDLAQHFTPPAFPITAEDLLARGMAEGKALGDRLRLLENVWEESDYTLSKDALLAGID